MRFVVNPPWANIDYVDMINAKDPGMKKRMGWNRILIDIVGLIEDNDMMWIHAGHLESVLQDSASGTASLLPCGFLNFRQDTREKVLLEFQKEILYYK